MRFEVRIIVNLSISIFVLVIGTLMMLMKDVKIKNKYI